MTDTIQVKIQDGLFDNFTIVQNAFIEAGFDPTEIAVYLVLCYYANPKKGNTCYPSYDTIARRVNRSRRRVIDSIEVLEKSGVIERETRPQGNGKHHLSNVYTILPIAGKPIVVWSKGSEKNDTEPVLDANDVENFTTPSEKNDTEACQKFHPNNNYLEQELLEQTEGSKDVCLPLSNDDKEIPSALEEKEEGIGATVIDMNTDIYAPALRALATEFGHFATYDEQRLLARHIDERGLPAVLDAIRACKQINAHPHSPAKYVIGYLNNIPHITSEMTEHVKAYSSPKTNNIPDYKPTQSEYADLKEIARQSTPNEIARFIKHLKEESFWQGKIVTTSYIRKNLSAWKAQQ